MTLHACISNPCLTCQPYYVKWCGHQWWTVCGCSATVHWPSTTTTITWPPEAEYVGRHRPEYVRPKE